MKGTCSEQIIAYISPELRKQLEQDRKSFGMRISRSSYIEHVLREYITAKRADVR